MTTRYTLLDRILLAREVLRSPEAHRLAERQAARWLMRAKRALSRKIAELEGKLKELEFNQRGEQ